MANETPEAQPPAPDPLLEKLLKASRDAKTVEKAGKNTQQKYDYARAEDVIREARRALHKAGLVAVIDFTVEGAKAIQSSGGTAGLFVRVAATLRVLDPESGRALTVAGIGTGSDYPGDKAPYKAMTGASKYLYASTLGIPFGDDPEDERGDGPAQAPSKPAKPLGFTDAAQRDAFVKALGDGVRSDAELATLLGAVNQAMPVDRIDNAGSQLLNPKFRMRAIANLRKLAGLDPLDLEAPDTRDLADVEAVEGEVVSGGPPDESDDVLDELFPDEPTGEDERL